MPRDAININEILRSQGVVDYNPQILSQLLEFSYRYTADLLTDADDYRENTGKPLISRKDIELAIQVKAKLFNDTQPTQQVRDEHGHFNRVEALTGLYVARQLL